MTPRPTTPTSSPGRGSARGQEWPARGAVCLACRTALPRGELCPGGRAHLATALDDPDGRERLVAEVWGPKSLRRQVTAAARAGTASGTGAGFFDACSLGDCATGVAELEGLLVGAVIAVAAFAVWLTTSLVVAVVRWWRRRPQPRGPRRSLPPLGWPTRRFGTVVATRAERPDPVMGRRAVAFAVELVHRSGWSRRRRILVDAVSLGFDVELDTGERVRVPPGLCLLDLRAARPVFPDEERVEAYLAGLDPLRASASDLDPFLHNVVRHLVIQAGQRVEVRGQLIPVADGGASPVGLYREAAAVLLVPDGGAPAAISSSVAGAA
jgi:hypothetical protein